MIILKIYQGTAQPRIARGRHQVAMMEFAEKYRGWNTCARGDRAARRAMAALAARGYLEVTGDQFRYSENAP